MNRRDFVRHALTGLGLASLPSSTLFAAPAAPIVPAPVPPGVPPLSTPGMMTRASYAPLLERARAVLAANPDKFPLRDRVALADFTLASYEHRFFIVDLVSGQASSYLVAHGKGSDPEHSGFLQSFSNEPNSLATSEGAYQTSVLYDGTHGPSMRLVGLDPTNSNADMRAIVVHGADYVSEDHIATWGKVGRSEGCFAVPPHLLPQVLGLLGPGRLLYAAKV
ncbi:MAG TPA: murein L,D-transpeptidase catalytic domain family protein [Sphingobium sp.]|uniref:murein L,D-transpeptidase catalytic domain family protein n=1 Tax=Sphingobium sp. TaxID=1912891 RepID=UPI002ED18457